MLKYYSSYLLVLGGLAHLLCCGIPFVLGISAVFSNLVASNTFIFDLEFLESSENYLFAFTTLLLLIVASSEIYNKKIKLNDENDCCTVPEYQSKQKKIMFNIYFAFFLYVINFSLFISEKI